MKKKVNILRFREISLTDLLIHLLKNAWVVLLIALASALTAWSVIGATVPTHYTGSITVSVRSALNSASWNSQLYSSRSAATKLAKSINDGSISTDFASEDYNRKINATVIAQQIDVATTDNSSSRIGVTNLVKITVTAETHDEVYFYLTSLVNNLDNLFVQLEIENYDFEAVTTPTMPESALEQSERMLISLAMAVLGGLFAVALVVFFRVIECVPATRKAADRILVLPVASALNKGGRGKGLNRDLPLLTSENANGCYTKRNAEAASYLITHMNECGCKRLQIVPFEAQTAHPNAAHSMQVAERIALNLALAMSDQGEKICLIDPSGAALTALKIEPAVEKQFYSIRGNRLVVCNAPIEQVDMARYDKIVFAQSSGAAAEGTHTLWVVPSGRYNAEAINAVTAPCGGTSSSASLLLYRLHTASDTASSADQKALTKKGRVENDDEIDLIRWILATLKVMWRIKIKWMAVLAIATVAALAVGLGVHYSNYRMDTVFAVATADVAAGLSAEQLETMTSEDVVNLMSDAASSQFNGNALYPSASPLDYDLLLTTMPVVWNAEATSDTIKSYLGWSTLDTSVKFSSRANESFVISVVGNDKDELKAVTDAFFEVAPSLSAHTAGGLTFVYDESEQQAAGMSVLLVLMLAWFMVIAAGGLYALIVGYNDRTALLAYEVEQAVSAPVIGRLVYVRRRKSAQVAVDDSTEHIDVELAGFIYRWAEKEKSQRILMITSALRKEGVTQLTGSIEALLKQNGKRVAIADKTICDRLRKLSDDSLDNLLASLWSKCDFLLLDCPGMAIDSEVTALAEKADGIIWAVRSGYAEIDRITNAADRIEQKEKILGCVMMTGNS